MQKRRKIEKCDNCAATTTATGVAVVSGVLQLKCLGLKGLLKVCVNFLLQRLFWIFIVFIVGGWVWGSSE